MDTNNGTVGGGEVLKYIGQGQSKGTQFIDEEVIKQFMMLPWVRAIIVILLIIIAIVLIFRLFDIKSPFKGRAITNELKHLDKIKKHDEAILRANNIMRGITTLIEHSPFAMSRITKDYWVYNLERANIRIPGGSRTMRPEEYHALITSFELLIAFIALIFAVFFSVSLGIILIVGDIIIIATGPKTAIRYVVGQKDLEIKANFADFYLMIHYVLLASANTSLSGIMKSYDKTTDSEEMHRFIDTCIHFIDTYGEYEATRYITKQYREIAEVGKLMRLIRQANEGGDIRSELMGFRTELLNAKKYAINKKMDKLIARARASFNILIPVLIQAIISAMAIYFTGNALTSMMM